MQHAQEGIFTIVQFKQIPDGHSSVRIEAPMKRGFSLSSWRLVKIVSLLCPNRGPDEEERVAEVSAGDSFGGKLRKKWPALSEGNRGLC
jgi:hypothetical protein